MTLTGSTIARNTLFYSAALTVQKLLSFFYFSFLARSLGSVTTGKYFFALSVGGIVAGIIDVGLTPVLVRETAKDTQQASRLVSTIITFKLILVSMLTVLAVLFVHRLFPDPVTRQLVVAALIIAVFDSFAMTFFATIRAHQNLLYESISAILFYCIVIALGTYAIIQRYDVRVIILALLAASFWNMLFGYLMLTKKIGTRVRVFWESVSAKSIAYAAIPFAIAAAFIKVYAYLDTVMLKYFVGDAAVGIYSVPYKITFAFQFIPMALVAALYPAFSYYWKHNAEELGRSFAKSFRYLLIVSLPIAGGLFAVAPALIPFVYSDAYTYSIAPLMILLVSLPFLFINFPIGSLLNACNRQTRQTIHLGVTMLCNAALNYVLIPRYGVIGAAVASTVSTIFIFFLGMFVVAKLVRVEWSSVLRFSAGAIAVTLAMVASVFFFSTIMPWFLAVVPAAIVYIAGLYILRVVTKNDVVEFMQLFKR